MTKSRVDITKSDHLTMWIDAAIGKNNGCIAISVSNIRHTFVFPTLAEKSNDAEFEGVVRALQLLITFNNWRKLKKVNVYSDNEVAIIKAREGEKPIDSLLKSFHRYAPDLVIKFQKLGKTHNVLQHCAASTWMAVMKSERRLK